MKAYKMLNGIDIEEFIDKPTEEETEYLDKYFPKGDNRRGDALVIWAFMKLQQKKIFDALTETCAICEKGKAIQWILKDGRKQKICQECLDDLIDEHILREDE